MKLIYASCLVVLLMSVLSCNNTTPTPPVENKTETSTHTDNDQFPDIQTLKENHEILLIRVAGDLNALSPATKIKLEGQKKVFNTAFEEYKELVSQRAELLETLHTLKADQGESAKTLPAWEQASTALSTANEAAIKAQDKYMELARQFSEMIETVKKERGH
jgi:predicted nuclease with TOPRIM domain